MTTQYASNFGGTQPFSDTAAQFSLAANTAQTYTVPGDSSVKYKVTFGYNDTANVYVGYNVTATSPTAGTNTTSGNIEFRPEIRFVKGGDVLSILTPDTTAHIGLSLLQLPG